MLTLPAFQTISANFKYNVILGNSRVDLEFVYNIRNACWFLTFTDEDGVILQGIKCVPDFPLLRGRKSFIDFDGDIFIIANTGVDTDSITYDNFGVEFSILYLTETETNEWLVENGLQ